MIKVYIDVSNLLPRAPHERLTDSVISIIRACRHLEPENRTRVHVRLYGGWYQLNELTKTAQLVSAEISMHFPLVNNVIENNGLSLKSTVTCELAVALESQPRRIFHGTYSEKAPDWRIKVKGSIDFDCQQTNCSLVQIRNTITKQKCALSACAIPLRQILYRSEQKMVDSMLNCDLMKNLGNSEDLIVVVSDDTDFFPSISCLAEEGVKVAWVVKNQQHSCAPLLKTYSNYHLLEI